MKSIRALVISTCCLFVSVVAFADAKLQPSSAQDFASWINQMPSGTGINTLVVYGQSQTVIQQLSPSYLEAAANKTISSQPLFVGAHFLVDREISTFDRSRLLDPKGISAISGSKIEVTSRSENVIEFKSVKSTPAKDLKCMNRARLLTWEEAKSEPGLNRFVSEILKQGSAEPLNAPITYQETFDCNDYLSHSQVVTFYFPGTDPSQNKKNQTRILSITLTYLNELNWFSRQIMIGQIESELLELSQIIKELGK